MDYDEWNAQDEDYDEEDALWETCDGEEEMVIFTTCLFCSSAFNSPHDAFRHCAEEHNFNILTYQAAHRLEYFDYIKMINFCRSQNLGVSDLMSTDPAAWSSEDYLKPVIQDDGLLQFDIEDISTLRLNIDNTDDPSTEVPNTEQSAGDTVPSSNGMAGTDDLSRALLDRCRIAEERASRAEQDLQFALEDIHKMRQMAGGLLSASDDVTPSHDAIKHLKEDEDEAYISGYSHFSIHEEMLKDRIRTEYYRDCMYDNAHLFKDKVVLDVGCGTAILSMFAARAGARKVIGVDMSDIIFQAMDIVRENRLEDKITLLKGRMEDLELPVDKVDIIISEWMGYFLLFESMLDTVLWSRDRYLADDGLILPDFCDLNIVGVNDVTMHDAHIKFWGDVYGFSMNCMKSCVMREASVGIVKEESIATEPVRLKEIDIHTCRTKDLDFTSPFKLTVTRDTELTALVGYFDIKWVLQDKACCFSTSPRHTPTHWKQTIFMLDAPLPVKQGAVLDGCLICKKSRKDPRSLDVILTLQNKTYTYVLA